MGFMTTLVGIRANGKKPGVILSSDMSRTQTSWKPQGDVAYRQQRRTEGQKIYVDPKKNFAVCMSGVFDQPYVDFLSAILDGKINLIRALKKENFSELRYLNEYRWKEEVPDTDLMNSLLVATRFDEPRLFACWPLGKVEEKAFASMGSGSGYALEHLREQGKLIPCEVGLEEAVDLSVEALDKASQDIYTGGLDLVAVTKGGIYDFGKDIRTEVNKARKRAVNKQKGKLRYLK